MMTKTATLDYLIFGKLTPHANMDADIHDFSYDEIAEHLKQRLQLDFYAETVELHQLDQYIFLNSSHWRDGDFVQHVPRSKETVIAHVSVDPVMIVPLILHDGQEHDLQDLVIVVTNGRHNFKSFNSVTRFARIPEPIAQLTELPSLINHINTMYQKQVFRLNLILDAGLLNGQLDIKQLSYLKTNFRQNFGETNCRLFVTNSRGKLGDEGKAITPFTANHHEISANNFINWLYDTEFEPTASDRMHEISLDKLMPYYSAPGLKGRSVVFLDSLDKIDDNKAEQYLKEINTQQQSQSQNDEVDSIESTKELLKTKIAKDSALDSAINAAKVEKSLKDSITEPANNEEYIQKRDAEMAREAKQALNSLARKRQEAKTRPMVSDDSYTSNDSPSDVIKRHMSASNVFNSRVQIINAGTKSTKTEKKEE